jgi:hypothetical protein
VSADRSAPETASGRRRRPTSVDPTSFSRSVGAGIPRARRKDRISTGQGVPRHLRWLPPTILPDRYSASATTAGPTDQDLDPHVTDIRPAGPPDLGCAESGLARPSRHASFRFPGQRPPGSPAPVRRRDTAARASPRLLGDTALVPIGPDHRRAALPDFAHFRASRNRLARERLVLSVWMERARCLAQSRASSSADPAAGAGLGACGIPQEDEPGAAAAG